MRNQGLDCIDEECFQHRFAENVCVCPHLQAESGPEDRIVFSFVLDASYDTDLTSPPSRYQKPTKLQETKQGGSSDFRNHFAILES